MGDRLEHESWPASEAAKAFVTQASEALADASVASGITSNGK